MEFSSPSSDHHSKREQVEDEFPQTPDRFSVSLEGELIPQNDWTLNGKGLDSKKPNSNLNSVSDSDFDVVTPPPLTLTVPSGWVSPNRASSFYYVPVIITTSVILSILIITAVVGSVIYRKRKKRIIHLENGIEIKSDKKLSKLSRKWRKRARRRGAARTGAGVGPEEPYGGSERGDLSLVDSRDSAATSLERVTTNEDDNEEEDTRALTTASGRSGPNRSNSILTSRFSTRSHPLSNEYTPPTMMERRPSLLLSTRNLALLETSSYNPPTISTSPISTPPVETEFELLAPTEEVTGPPAYVHSTVASTSTLLPSHRVLEKRRESVTAPLDHEELEEEQVVMERSNYSGHLATDEKAVLSRLATFADNSTSNRREILDSSAPPIELEDGFDIDGFEIFEEEEDYENQLNLEEQEQQEDPEVESEDELEEGEIREGMNDSESEEGIWYGNFPPPSKPTTFQSTLPGSISITTPNTIIIETVEERLLALASAPPALDEAEEEE